MLRSSRQTCEHFRFNTLLLKSLYSLPMTANASSWLIKWPLYIGFYASGVNGISFLTVRPVWQWDSPEVWIRKGTESDLILFLALCWSVPGKLCGLSILSTVLFQVPFLQMHYCSFWIFNIVCICVFSAYKMKKGNIAAHVLQLKFSQLKIVSTMFVFSVCSVYKKPFIGFPPRYLSTFSEFEQRHYRHPGFAIWFFWT